MASYTEDEYEKIIRSNALRAFKRLQEVDPKKYTYNVNTADNVKRKYAEYQDKLRKWRPIDQMTKGYEFALNDYNADSLMNWLEGDKDYKAPDEYEGQSEASKILPLLKGVAKEGEDWYSVGAKKLQKMADKLGYNTNVPGAFSEFLKLVGDYQMQYDRAKLLQEGQQGANYWANKFFYPSSTQEAENAVLTGEGGDNETLSKLRTLDAVTSGAMALAPSLRLGKVGTAIGLPVLGNPLVNSTINAGLQGVIEGVRQLGTEKLSTTGQKAEISPAILALTAGATRPGMTLGASGLATQLPGKVGQDIARGVRRGARVGGSTERQQIESAVKLYNKDLAKAVLDSKGGNVSTTILDRTGRKYDKALQVPEMADMFGIAPDANGKYSAKEIIKYYDLNPETPTVIITENGKASPQTFVNSIIPESNEFASLGDKLKAPFTAPKGERIKYIKDVMFGKPYMSLGQDKISNYVKLFPEKAADLNANRAAYNTGELLGQLVSEAGGRVEPIVGTNPFKVYNSASVAKSYTESYKNEPWYKKLEKTDPESAKIIAEAFKKKAEEEEEQ